MKYYTFSTFSDQHYIKLVPGKTYTFSGENAPMQSNIYLHKNLNVLDNIFDLISPKTTVFEIEALGDIHPDWSGEEMCNKIKVVRIVPKEEYSSLCDHDFTFDERGNISRVENREDGSWQTFKFDDNNNLIHVEDNNGDYMDFEFDSEGNNTKYSCNGEVEWCVEAE